MQLIIMYGSAFPSYSLFSFCLSQSLIYFIALSYLLPFYYLSIFINSGYFLDNFRFSNAELFVIASNAVIYAQQFSGIPSIFSFLKFPCLYRSLLSKLFILSVFPFYFEPMGLFVFISFWNEFYSFQSRNFTFFSLGVLISWVDFVVFF